MATYTDPRITELERALAHARSVADAERKRAELAEASARRAWQLATWRGRQIELATGTGPS
jgi:hypothetical protein